MEYLFGEGRAEEHTDPHIVAAYTDLLVGDRAGTAFARKALAGELDFHRVSLAPDVTEKFVFHAAVSMAAVDGPLTEAMWADVATSIAGHLGFSEHGVRWMAVHHGTSAGGNDHIHLVANLIGEDGRKHRFPRPPGVMLGEARKQLEIRHGLRQIGHTNGVDHGVGLGSHSRAETTRAAREQQETPTPGQASGGVLEPESVRLERAVRAAAAAAGSEAEFVAELREQRVVVRPRMTPGSPSAGPAVSGFSVALPTGGGGQQLLWFGGGRLAKDLTLPALRAHWEANADDTAVTAARAAAVGVWQSRAGGGEHRRVDADRRHHDEVEAARAAGSTPPDTAGREGTTSVADTVGGDGAEQGVGSTVPDDARPAVQPQTEPEPGRLERAVRTAAADSGSEAEFVTALREQRVIVRPRIATGTRAESAAAVGYSVALPTGGSERQLRWCGGGSLGRDLTLPALRARWEAGADGAAVAAARAAAIPVWRGGDRDAVQRRTAATYPSRPEVESDLVATSTHIDTLGRWAHTYGPDEKDTAREAARLTAGIVAAAATRLPPEQQAPFHATARALARLAQPERAGLRGTPGGFPAAHRPPQRRLGGGNVVAATLLHAATGAHQRAGWIAVYQALANTAAVVALAHRSTEVSHTEQVAAEAAARQALAFANALQPPRPAVDPQRWDSSFPVPLAEKLAWARRAGATTTPPKPSSPTPGRGPDRGYGR